MSMSQSELDRIVKNEIEWRKWMLTQVSETKQELHEFKIEMATITTTLKVKVGLAGAFFGFIGGSFISVLVALIK